MFKAFFRRRSFDPLSSEVDELTDLDKLYMALGETGLEYVCDFDALCYSLNITSLKALAEYNAGDSTVLASEKILKLKREIKSKHLNFKDLAIKKYKQSKVFETCKMKQIPVISKKDVVVTRTLEQGPFKGQVCEALLTLPNGRQEKVCLRYETSEDQHFLHQADIANRLRHENILDFYGVVIASSYSPSVALVEEFVEYGNLKESATNHSIESLCRFTIQAATALEYLEKRNVVHQSVRSFNIMVVAGYQLKLAGIGACLFENDPKRKNATGTSPKDMVFRFGQVFADIFYCHSQKYGGVPGLLADEKDSRYGYMCPSHFCDVFHRCFLDNVHQRPSFSEIRQSLIAQGTCSERMHEWLEHA